MQIDEFTRAYIECALWSSHYMKNDIEFHFDETHNIDDLASETLGAMIADCAKFQLEHAAALKNAYKYKAGMNAYEQNTLPDYDESQAGHDFWLTRNGHGAGFWDRGLGELGTLLTMFAKAFPPRDLYIGDDGKIYAE